MILPTRRSVLKHLALTATAPFVRRAGLAPEILAQNSSSDSDAPLHDPLRPSFHYLPARNWMNDPCGPIYHHGHYHLFHQYNPHAALWGDMHWAHAISPDMVHWRRLPIALAPTPHSPDSAGCFTGTAVLHDGRPTILYTGVQTVPRAEATIADGASTLRESQCLAVAADDTLGDWKKLPAPVIPTPPPGIQVTGFRDPSPWKDTTPPNANTWYTIVGSGIAKQGGMVLLYRSPDLRSWQYLHPLVEGTWSGIPGPNPVDTGEMWECPDFFPLTDAVTHIEQHVLIYSTQGKVLWQAGTLDRSAMRFQSEKHGELDYGRVGASRVTFYAPKTQLDAHGNRILWGWIAETRPDAACVRAGWSGMMSLPRLLTLRDGELHMEPAPALTRLRSSAPPAQQTREFTAILEAPITAAATPVGPAPFTLVDASGPLLAIRSDLTQDPRTLHLSFADNIPPIVIPMPAPLPATASIHAFFDNSVLELFIDRRFCLTHRFYTRARDQPLATLTLAGAHGVSSPRSFSLTPIWPV